MKQQKATQQWIGEAGRPYGHVPGHHYLDVEIVAQKRRGGWVATATVTHGSAQGSHDEEHGRVEYVESADSAEAAILAVRDLALREQSDETTRGYVHTAAAQAVGGGA